MELAVISTPGSHREVAFDARATAFAILDKLDRGVVLMDGRAMVLHTNRAAVSILARKVGLVLSSGRLRFSRTDHQSRLESYLANKSGTSTDPLMLRMEATTPSAACRVLISPIRPSRDGTVDAAEHIVFVHEPETDKRPLPASLLKNLYELTPGEARLANELYSGRSVGEAANRLGITTNTARSVLKNVFLKCGISSQAELLQMLSLGPRTI